MTRILFLVVFSLLLAPALAQDPPGHPRGFRSEKAMKVAAAFKLVRLIEPNPEPGDSLLAEKGILYTIAGEDSLFLDIYRKKEMDEKAPAIVFIHGGSWSGGERSDYNRYLVDFAARGYVTISVDYRLSKKERSTFPEAVYDIKTALGWIHSNADKYMIDNDRTALVGGSAGAHLAMLTAYSPEEMFIPEGFTDTLPEIKAVVDIYGPADLTTEYARVHKKTVQFLGADHFNEPHLFEKASPVRYIHRQVPPTLIFHGSLDTTVPIFQSDMLYESLKMQGAMVEYHRLEGWPHIMDMASKVNEYCQYYMASFFERTLE